MGNVYSIANLMTELARNICLNPMYQATPTASASDPITPFAHPLRGKMKVLDDPFQSIGYLNNHDSLSQPKDLISMTITLHWGHETQIPCQP